MTRGALTTLSVAVYLALTAAVLICVGVAGSELMSARDRLATVDDELRSVSGHADPLTYQVTKVNDSLVRIEQALSPIHSQADMLNGILGGVQQTLTSANGSANSINAAASAAEGSLRPADSALQTTNNSVLHATPGVGVISSQAAQALGILTPIQSDASTISGLLAATNQHLSSACQKTRNAPGGAGTACH
jgi:phage-related minor tail protein